MISRILNGLLNQSNVNWTALNIKADSDAMLPKGAKAILVYLTVNDLGSAAGVAIFRLRANLAAVEQYETDISGTPNDVARRLSGLQSCNPDGDVEYRIVATGANTFDIQAFYYKWIQLN